MLTKCSTTCPVKLQPLKFKTSRFEVLVKACKITSACRFKLRQPKPKPRCLRFKLLLMTFAKSFAIFAVMLQKV